MTANDEQLLGNQHLTLSGSAADLPTTSAERGPEHFTHREWYILREVLPALTYPYIASANQLLLSPVHATARKPMRCMHKLAAVVALTAIVALGVAPTRAALLTGRNHQRTAPTHSASRAQITPRRLQTRRRRCLGTVSPLRSYDGTRLTEICTPHVAKHDQEVRSAVRDRAQRWVQSRDVSRRFSTTN